MNDLPGNLAVIDRTPPADDYARALLEGFGQSPRRIPCRFLYDAQGSDIFEAITALPEYYPTRTEIGLLERHAAEMAALAGPAAEVIELGCGASRKARLLLDALDGPAAYLGIDVSASALVDACRALARDYPAMKVGALIGDFTRIERLPGRPGRRLAFFPGSTIGNFPPREAMALLSHWQCLLAGGDMIVGVDLQKEPATLLAAYDDSAGVTAAFNLNLLTRANREAGADFELGAWRHAVRYEAEIGRVSLYIESLKGQSVRIGGARFDFAAGERIHTEDSWKFTVEGFRGLAEEAGFRPLATWTDDQRRFSLHYLRGRY